MPETRKGVAPDKREAQESIHQDNSPRRKQASSLETNTVLTSNKTQFVAIPHWVQDHADLTPTEFAVLAAFVRRADYNTGECWPAVADLAALARCSERAVRSATRRLQALGIVTIARSGQGRTSNTYQVNLSNMPVALKPAQAADLKPAPRSTETGTTFKRDLHEVPKNENQEQEPDKENQSNRHADARRSDEEAMNDAQRKAGFVKLATAKQLKFIEDITAITGVEPSQPIITAADADAFITETRSDFFSEVNRDGNWSPETSRAAAGDSDRGPFPEHAGVLR